MTVKVSEGVNKGNECAHSNSSKVTYVAAAVIEEKDEGEEDAAMDAVLKFMNIMVDNTVEMQELRVFTEKNEEYSVYSQRVLT